MESLESRLLLTSVVSQTWTDVSTYVPGQDSAQLAIQLSDGTVLVHGFGEDNRSWYKLTPNASGSYINGTWSTVAPMNVGRLYFASNVLPDGRIFVVGGEYSNGGSTPTDINSAEIYDPAANVWSNVAPSPLSNFGDDPSEVLPNGSVLCGDIFDSGTEIYTPPAIGTSGLGAWTTGPSKVYGDEASDEECWVKLPDGSILSYDIYASIDYGVGKAERYIPSTNTWVDASAGTLPVLSTPSQGYELGGAILLPDGRAFFTGADGKTAFYNTITNTWSQGPSIPNSYTMGDAPIALEPNGDVLMATSPAVNGGKFPGPTVLYDFDPVTQVYTNVTPPSSKLYLGGNSFEDTMLVLPTGQVMVLDDSGQVAIYTPTLNPQAAWQPVITNIVNNEDGTYTLTGTQLNGISEGAAYGDDNEMSSNYPIIRIDDTVTGNVLYAKSYDWSSVGVDTGSTPETVIFTLPAGLGGDAYTVQVIASGIGSAIVGTGVPFKLYFAQQPTSTTAGSTLAPPVQVDVEDFYGNIVNTDNSTITLTLNGSSVNAALRGTVTLAASNGVAIFSNLSVDAGALDATGAYTLSAADTGLAGAASASFAVAGTDTWTGAVSSAWSIPGNWSADATPGPFTSVVINSGNPIASAGFTIAGLTLNGGIPQLLGGSGGYTATGITLAGVAQMDLTNAHMVFNFLPASDPWTTIQGYLKSGYNHGAWTGPGIISSTAATHPAYAIGSADGADLIVTGLSVGQIELTYTLYGDLNLDYSVNGADFSILAANFGKSVSGWDEGDLNYDGFVSGSDFGFLAHNFGKTAAGVGVQSAAIALSTPTTASTTTATDLLKDRTKNDTHRSHSRHG